MLERYWSFLVVSEQLHTQVALLKLTLPQITTYEAALPALEPS